VQQDESIANGSRTAAAAFVALVTASAARSDQVGDTDSSDNIGRIASPFVSPDRAMSFSTSTLGHRRRRALRRSGVVCECCIHRCSLDELQAYCGTPTN